MVQTILNLTFQNLRRLIMKKSNNVYIAYFDGACEPVNPGGTASFGAVIFEDDRQIWECSDLYQPPEGHQTSNNVAETN
jgi:ribonuclease HI